MEGMDGYCGLIESQLPDWKTNAQKMFGARGIVAPIVGSPNTGLHLHVCNGKWAWEFWTAGAGWLVSYFYDYYRFTGDRDFLAKRAVECLDRRSTSPPDAGETRPAVVRAASRRKARSTPVPPWSQCVDRRCARQ